MRARRTTLANALQLTLAIGFASVAAACGAQDPAKAEAAGDAGCEDRGEPVVLGMTNQSDDGTVMTTLTAATPLPPLQGTNTWTVNVETSSGPVLDENENDDSHVLINIFMADHDHNLRKAGSMTSPGIFEFPPLPITMAGYWEFTIRVEPDQPVADEHEDVLFGFCVPKD